MLSRASLLEWLFLIGWPILVIILVLAVSRSTNEQSELALHNHAIIMENQKLIKEEIDAVMNHVKVHEAYMKKHEEQ